MPAEYLDIDNIVSNIEDDDVGFELHTGLMNESDISNIEMIQNNLGFQDDSAPTPKLEMDKDLVALYNKPTDINDGVDTTTVATTTAQSNGGDSPSKINGDNQEVEILKDILTRKGVKDFDKIPFEDDNGEIEYHAFDDLDYETQLDILTSIQEDDSTGLNLDQSETELITYLRDNNLTLQQVLDKQRDVILEELGEQVGRIDFDSVSDEDLYILEMQSAYDISEEDALVSLEVEKQNEDIFKKKIQKLRADYKQAEENRIEEEEQTVKNQQEQEYQQFGQGLFEVAKTVDQIGGLTLEDADKGEILDLVLELDTNGASAFSKMFQDKETLFRLAWFALKGEEAFDKIHTHYKEVIEQTRREAKGVTTKESGYKLRISNKDKTTTKVKKDDIFSIDYLV